MAARDMTSYSTMEPQYQQMPYYVSPQAQAMYQQPEHQVVYQQPEYAYQADPNSLNFAAYAQMNQYPQTIAALSQFSEHDAQCAQIYQQQYTQQLHAIQNPQMQAANANYQVVMQYADGSTTTAIVPEQYLQQYCQSANINTEASKVPQNYPPVNQYPPGNVTRQNSMASSDEDGDCVKKPVRQLSEVGSETGVNEGRVTPPLEMDGSPTPEAKKLESREYTLTPENVPRPVRYVNQAASPSAPTTVVNANHYAQIYADPNQARAALNNYHAHMAQSSSHLSAPNHVANLHHRQHQQLAPNHINQHSLHNQGYSHQLRHPAYFVAQNAAFMGSEALKKKTKRRRQSREEARRARRAPRFQLPEDIPPMAISQLSELGEEYDVNSESLKSFLPAHAKFVIIKSFHEDDVHKAVKFGLWSSTPHGNEKLQKVFEDAHSEAIQLSQDGSGLDANGNPICPIFLFFSVNKSKGFCGIAKMSGAVDFDKKVDWWVRKNDGRNKWRGAIKVEWVSVKDVPNTVFQDLCFPGFTHRPLIFSRDTTELPSAEGSEFLRRFVEFKSQTTLLQDMPFYDEEYEEFLKNGGNKSDFEASTSASSVAGSLDSNPVTPESGVKPANQESIVAKQTIPLNAKPNTVLQKIPVPTIRQPTYAQKVAAHSKTKPQSNNWAQLVAKSPPGMPNKTGPRAFKPILPVRKNSGFGRAVHPTA